MSNSKNIFSISDYITYNEALDMGANLIAEAYEWVENSVAGSELTAELRESSLSNLMRAAERLNWLQANVYSK